MHGKRNATRRPGVPPTPFWELPGSDRCSRFGTDSASTSSLPEGLRRQKHGRAPFVICVRDVSDVDSLWCLGPVHSFTMPPLLSVVSVFALYGLQAAASPFESSPLAPRAPAPKPIVGSYAYQGCISEPKVGKALPTVWSDPTMTLEKCATQAAKEEFMYFGVEFGKECWTGNHLNQAVSAAADGSCSMACKGDASEACGGSKKMSLYVYQGPATGGGDSGNTGGNNGSNNGSNNGGNGDGDADSGKGYVAMGW
jgi:hypothetical protein